jgi:hypothetical protein
MAATSSVVASTAVASPVAPEITRRYGSNRAVQMEHHTVTTEHPDLSTPAQEHVLGRRQVCQAGMIAASGKVVTRWIKRDAVRYAGRFAVCRSSGGRQGETKICCEAEVADHLRPVQGDPQGGPCRPSSPSPHARTQGVPSSLVPFLQTRLRPENSGLGAAQL